MTAPDPPPSAALDAWCVGDVVVDRDGSPIGTIEAVVRAASGSRLVVTLSGSRDRLGVISARDVATTLEEALGPVRRHVLAIAREAVASSTTYRREMGRLVSSSAHWVPGPPVPNDAWARVDDLTVASVRDGLAGAHLTATEPIEVAAWHGVVHLRGRVSTDASALEAMRIARGAVGAWHVVSTTVSDEALAAHLRRHVRASPLAPAVASVTVVHGIGTITLVEGATFDDATSAAWEVATPGLASLVVRPRVRTT